MPSVALLIALVNTVGDGRSFLISSLNFLQIILLFGCTLLENLTHAKAGTLADLVKISTFLDLFHFFFSSDSVTRILCFQKLSPLAQISFTWFRKSPPVFLDFTLLSAFQLDKCHVKNSAEDAVVSKEFLLRQPMKRSWS